MVCHQGQVEVDVTAAKRVVRLELRRRRACLDAAAGAESSVRVCRRLVELTPVATASTLAAYAACRGEVDVDAVIRIALERGQRVFLPRFAPALDRYEMVAVTDLAADTGVGHAGIREPLSTLPAATAAQLVRPDVAWLVPGLGFDRAGNRLGHGRGYYDRLLAGARGWRIGVAHVWQVLEALPHAPHDERMDMIVTAAETMIVS